MPNAARHARDMPNTRRTAQIVTRDCRPDGFRGAVELFASGNVIPCDASDCPVPLDLE
jgi:hypothetical protein